MVGNLYTPLGVKLVTAEFLQGVTHLHTSPSGLCSVNALRLRSSVVTSTYYCMCAMYNAHYSILIECTLVSLAIRPCTLINTFSALYTMHI